MIPEGMASEYNEPQSPHPSPPQPPPRPQATPPRPAAPRRAGSHGCLVVAVLGLLMLFGLAALMLVGSMIGDGLDTERFVAGDAVAVVKVEGLLADAEQVVEELERYSRMSSVKAIVVRINSPGGMVAPTQEIYAALRRVKNEKRIPVVASMGTVAASGGYYVALGADTIVANPGTATGSIGVILSYPTFGELFNKIGVSLERVKSGDFKDIGDPTRPLNDEERAILQERLDDVYQQFIEAVAESRGMTQDEVRAIADGRVYTGRQAVELGLIDKQGDLHDAIQLAADAAGIEGEPRVLKKKRRGLYGLFYSMDTTAEMMRLRAQIPHRLPMFLMQ